MSSNCLFCDNPVKAEEVARCSVCRVGFHPKCINETVYRCEKCGDEDEASSAAVRSDEQGAIFKAIAVLDEKFDATLVVVRNSINSLKNESTRLASSVEDLKGENAELKEECFSLHDEVDTLSAELRALNRSFLHMDQYSRSNNIEIAGVPVTVAENVYEILARVANVLNVRYAESVISIAYRLRPSYARDQPPPIVATFVSRRLRETWLAAARRTGMKIRASHLDLGFPDTTVYVREQLTGNSKMLLGRSKVLVREKKLADAWMSAGRLMAKRNDGDPPTRVFTIEDLDNMASY